MVIEYPRGVDASWIGDGSLSFKQQQRMELGTQVPRLARLGRVPDIETWEAKQAGAGVWCYRSTDLLLQGHGVAHGGLGGLLVAA